MTPPLSVTVITRNEAARLGRTLEAVRGLADQIVVVDSGSTDATVGIARAAGAEVHHRDWTGYGAQKRFAEDLCRNRWVLNIDADEVVTPALADEIRALFSGGPPAPGGWRVRILTVYPGDFRPRPLARDYNPVRLYHLDAGRYRDHPLFDRVELGRGVRPGQLRAPIHHHPFLSFEALVAKQNALTTYQAETARPKPRAVLLLRLVAEFPYWFLRNWIVRGHVLGGWKGFAFSVTVGFSRFLRVVKMLERAGR